MLQLILKKLIINQYIVCNPLLSPIELALFLGSGIEKIIIGGESGDEACPCHFDWIFGYPEAVR